MAATFLDGLSLTDDERGKLAELGATHPEQLLDAIAASRGAFESWFGADRTARLEDNLNRLIGPSREAVAPPFEIPSFGVPLSREPAATLPDPGYDVAERDRLYARLEALRHRASLTDAEAAEATDLERRLTRMLEGE